MPNPNKPKPDKIMIDPAVRRELRSHRLAKTRNALVTTFGTAIFGGNMFSLGMRKGIVGEMEQAGNTYVDIVRDLTNIPTVVVAGSALGGLGLIALGVAGIARAHRPTLTMAQQNQLPPAASPEVNRPFGI